MKKFIYYQKAKYDTETGGALILVLMLLVIVSASLLFLTKNFQQNFKKNKLYSAQQQSFWYALSIENLGLLSLRQTFEDNSNNINQSQIWASFNGITYDIDDSQLSISIKDMSSCFNINSFNINKQKTTTIPREISIYQDLLKLLEIDDDIVFSIWDFINLNPISVGDSVSESIYENNFPPFKSANRTLSDFSEIRVVDGMTSQKFKQMRLLSCAIPSDKLSININTLNTESAILLSAIYYPELTSEDAKKIIEDRPFDGWSSVDEFLSISGLKNSTDKKYLSVKSDYFLIESSVKTNNMTWKMRSLFYQNKNKWKNFYRFFGNNI
ncbi:type II secretion system minor pseudopilin GspK [Paraphotobacterium marinum]|uniref:type II secretion system minor pseudopilin GspK n=1 Tax=Paraphotobacterium marinum TaxID=1755811 RepID=UPI0039E74313